MRTIFELDNFRIIERADYVSDLSDLKGDSYCPKVNSDIAPEVLKKEEKDFEDKLNREGVFGYELQLWNPEVNQGWQYADSCWGFVGQYEEKEESDFNHYIVAEFKAHIHEATK